MAKDRSDRMDVDKAASKEKKAFKDKIQKSKKAEKPNIETDTSGDESSKVGLISHKKQAPEMVLALRSDPVYSGLVASGRDETFHEMNYKLRNTNHITIKASNGQESGNDIFMVDVKPTKVNPNAIKPPIEEEEEGGARVERDPGYTAPPSGKNRATRRRQMLIDRQKAHIQKALGVAVGSEDKADEVQMRLDIWIRETDGKNAARTKKATERKLQELMRLRNKKGKLPTGRELKEKEKSIRSRSFH